jgi:hypothetical protein
MTAHASCLEIAASGGAMPDAANDRKRPSLPPLVSNLDWLIADMRSVWSRSSRSSVIGATSPMRSSSRRRAGWRRATIWSLGRRANRSIRAGSRSFGP